MMRMLAKMGSLKITAALLLPLIATVFLINRLESMNTAWVAVPLSLLSVNLLAAIATNAAFRRQPPLLVFHIFLLATIIFAGFGTLTEFDGHVELVEGESFDSSQIELTKFGRLRQHGPDNVRFTQGKIAVDYAPNLIRQSTTSDVVLGGDDEATEVRRIGDRISTTIDGYRFATSFNKGFAVLIHWDGDDSRDVLGAINMPAYPEFAWKQVNNWTTPGGEDMQFELLLHKRPDRTGSWRLQSNGVNFSLKITGANGETALLGAGDRLALADGAITVAGLRMWMGYRVDSNAYLLWTLLAAFASVAALGWHFANKYFSVPSNAPAETIGVRNVCVG